MRLAEYTPDSICNAMGFRAFQFQPEDQSVGPWMRLLLMPSFHPEVCILIHLDGVCGIAEVRTFDALFWHNPTPAHHPALFVETVSLDLATVVNFEEAFQNAVLATQADDLRYVTLDGMPGIAICRAADGKTIEMNENLGGVSPFNSWVRTVAQIIHKSLLPGRCRNASAAAGVYVDLKLSSDSLPALVPVTHVMVLGDEVDRRQVKDILNEMQFNSGSDKVLPENA